jgi:hypothetical protein
MRFCPLVLFINRTHLGPCLLYYILFEFCFEFAEFSLNSKFVLRYGPQRGTNYFADTRD